MGDAPGPRQHPFRLGIALSSRLLIPVVFRLLAFASWTILCPLETSASLTVGVPADRPPDSIGITTFRTCERRPGEGAFYTAGLSESSTSHGRGLVLAQDHRLGQASLSVAAADVGLNEGSLPFTLPDLPLARCAPDASEVLGRFPDASDRAVTSTTRQEWGQSWTLL